MVYRKLTESEIFKLKKGNIYEREDCIEEMLTHKNKKGEGVPKIVKNRVITGYDIEKLAHNALFSLIG